MSKIKKKLGSDLLDKDQLNEIISRNNEQHKTSNTNILQSLPQTERQRNKSTAKQIKKNININPSEEEQDSSLVWLLQE